MKKVVTLLLVLSMILALAACGGSGGKKAVSGKDFSRRMENLGFVVREDDGTWADEMSNQLGMPGAVTGVYEAYRESMNYTEVHVVFVTLKDSNSAKSFFREEHSDWGDSSDAVEKAADNWESVRISEYGYETTLVRVDNTILYITADADAVPGSAATETDEVLNALGY